MAADDLTIFIADVAGAAAPVFDAIHGWTAQAALGDSLWVDRAGDGRSAQLVAKGEVEVVDLVQTLADRHVRRLRVVALHVVADDEAAADSPSAADDRDRLLAHPRAGRAGGA